MAQIIEMPLLSDTMTEGVIAAWHKKVGDTVKAGDLLAEVETDKATMEVESYYTGVLLYTAVPDGGSIPIASLMAIIGDAGEDVSAIVAQYAAKQAGKTPAAEPAPVSTPAPVATSVPAVATPAAQAPAPVSAVASASASASFSADADGRLKASPLAKALAREKGIDLHAVAGSGDGGRVVKRDVETYQPTVAPVVQTQVHAPAAVPSFAPVVGSDGYEEVTLSQMRKTIARRLSESKFSAPHFYLTIPIDMGVAMQLRKELNEQQEAKISFNDLVIKAVAVSLRKHPKVNASWLGDKIRYHHGVHVGMAVAVDEGLVVPVIRNADLKGLTQISAEAKDYAARARTRKLTPEEMQGNTFTISNLGMFGIEEFTAIINPPDACILAVGAIQEQPVVKNGEIVPGHIMRVTLSCDHRAVDGAVGSAFLQTLKFLLENPVRMLL